MRRHPDTGPILAFSCDHIAQDDIRIDAMAILNKSAFLCIVITLDDAQARRDAISARLRVLGIPFEFVPGVDGRKLDTLIHPGYDSFRRGIYFGRDLSKGELGCALAHRNACRHALESGHDAILILEDDALLADDLPAVIADLLALRDKWDLVRFLGRKKNYRASRLITPLAGSQAMLARPLGTPGGAYGYLLNPRAAKRLLELTQKIWLPVDTLHGMTWHTGLATLSVVPSPILPNDDTPSCIDGQDAHRRWDKSVTLSGGWRLVYPLTRASHKLRFALLGRCMRLRTLLPDLLLRLRNHRDTDTRPDH
ncbi:MAG TPA: glycosyltransferase family 25 protein [Thiobacillaceae bacterium]|nr:glycosyltransferase family 25 protein [Thiobacillaceae bacterium]HNU63918.1 glycosyltransferase family 25 protein [Thiobacillaceae bacterium]